MALTVEQQLRHTQLVAELAGMDPSLAVVPEDKFVEMNGLRFHYLDWGGGGEAVVFLHGGGLTAHSWDLVCLAMRASFRCIALDQRGHGDSEWSPSLEYEPEFHAGDVDALADQLGLGSFSIVGQSMGAYNGLAYAMARGSRLDRLVVVDAGPWVSWTGARPIVDFMSAPGEHDSIDAFVERALEFRPSRNRELLRTSLLHNLRRLPDGGWAWKYDRRWMNEEGFRAVRERQVRMRDQLHRVRCPTLVVRGGESKVLSPEDARQFADSLPDGELVTVPGAGHTVQGDRPLELSEVLLSFLG